MRTIDAHAHLGAFPGFVPGGERTAPDLIREWDTYGIEGGMISILDNHNPRSGNERVEAAWRQFPDRIHGFGYLNPHDVEGSIREVERCASLECFRGFKLHPANDVYYPFHERYYPVYSAIENTGLPTLWHSGTPPFSAPLQIAPVARRFPGSIHILAHFGIAELSWECAPAAELADNIVVDTCINPVIPVINEFIEGFGAERVLWGTDYPWYQVEYERLKIQFLGSSDRERELIAAENAARLFNL
jgi:uncharacterized protein